MHTEPLLARDSGMNKRWEVHFYCSSLGRPALLEIAGRLVQQKDA